MKYSPAAVSRTNGKSDPHVHCIVNGFSPGRGAGTRRHALLSLIGNTPVRETERSVVPSCHSAWRKRTVERFRNPRTDFDALPSFFACYLNRNRCVHVGATSRELVQRTIAIVAHKPEIRSLLPPFRNHSAVDASQSANIAFEKCCSRSAHDFTLLRWHFPVGKAPLGKARARSSPESRQRHRLPKRRDAREARVRYRWQLRRHTFAPSPGCRP